MQPIANYNTKEGFIRLLLQGPPGAGKSTTVCQFPKAYIIDVDVNLRGPLRFCKTHNIPIPIGYDRVDVDENGATVPLLARWPRLVRLVDNLPPEIETVVFDSATGLTDLLMTEVKRQQPSVKDGR